MKVDNDRFVVKLPRPLTNLDIDRLGVKRRLGIESEEESESGDEG